MRGARRRRRRHPLRPHLDHAQPVLQRQHARKHQRRVLAQREARAGADPLHHRRILRPQLLNGGEAGEEQRRLREHGVVQLLLGALQTDLEQVVAQDGVGGGQHRLDGGQVLGRGEHAHRLRALAGEEEGGGRVGDALGGARELLGEEWYERGWGRSGGGAHRDAARFGGAAGAAVGLGDAGGRLLPLAPLLLRVGVLVAARRGAAARRSVRTEEKRNGRERDGRTPSSRSSPCPARSRRWSTSRRSPRGAPASEASRVARSAPRTRAHRARKGAHLGHVLVLLLQRAQAVAHLPRAQRRSETKKRHREERTSGSSSDMWMGLWWPGSR